MSAIAKFVKLTTSPERLSALRAVLQDLADKTREEAGCLIYDVYDNDEGSCRIVEVWQDGAALEAHMAAHHTTKAIEAFVPMLTEEPEVEDYLPGSITALGT